MTRWRKARVYLDTSVISYLEQDDAPEKRDITREFWELLKQGSFDVVMSDAVYLEIKQCDEDKGNKLFDHLSDIQYEEVNSNEETQRIVHEFINRGILTLKSIVDCQHLAAAMYSGCDMIVSWNLKHIVCVKTLDGTREICAIAGYNDMFVATPEMVLEAGYAKGIPIVEP